MSKTKLTRKQKAFVEEYIETGNGTQSALKAYDTDSERTAAAIASENLTKPEIRKALEDVLSEELLIEKHLELMNATRLDHMTFPLGPVGEDEINLSGATPNSQNTMEDHVERTTLTDKEIVQMLSEVNCKVKRIVHGETARHVYFWSYDNQARDKALDKAYKILGKYAPEKRVTLNLTEKMPDERVVELARKLNQS